MNTKIAEPNNTNLFIDLVTYKLPLIQAIYVATKLNIADCIGDKEYEINDLSQTIGACKDNLYRLLKVLSSYGIFKETNEMTFINTEYSNMMRKEYPESVYDLILWEVGTLTWKSLEGLDQCVLNGETAFDKAFGMSFFKYLDQNQNHKRALHNALNAFNKISNPSIKQSYDFSKFNKILDIGGGQGELIIDIQEKYSNAECMLFEHEETISQLSSIIKQGINVFTGDFFTDELPEADCYILKLILHDWNNDQCIKLLKNCNRTLSKGGKLLIMEPAIIDGSPYKLFSQMLDLDMMILTGGKERTPEEYNTILNASGFKYSNIISTETPLYIIEANKV
jgi:SAM-dependent methyltransferase